MRKVRRLVALLCFLAITSGVVVSGTQPADAHKGSHLYYTGAEAAIARNTHISVLLLICGSIRYYSAGFYTFECKGK